MYVCKMYCVGVHKAAKLFQEDESFYPVLHYFRSFYFLLLKIETFPILFPWICKLNALLKTCSKISKL